MLTDGASVIQVRKSAAEQAVTSREPLIAEAAQSLIDHVDLRGDANGCVVIRLKGARSHVLGATPDFPWGPGDVLVAPAWPSTDEAASLILVPDSSRCPPLRDVGAAANVVVRSACIAPVVVHGHVVGAVIAVLSNAQPRICSDQRKAPPPLQPFSPLFGRRMSQRPWRATTQPPWSSSRSATP